MDPKTTANKSESDRQTAAATDGCEVAATAPERINAPPIRPIGQQAHASNQMTGSPRRVSLDPMRSTDRYRLVTPANAGL